MGRADPRGRLSVRLRMLVGNASEKQATFGEVNHSTENHQNAFRLWPATLEDADILGLANASSW
jgi:hypothetical protein